MSAEMRMRSDDERALRWLQRHLEWEEILAALRQAGSGRRIGPVPHKQEPAAA